MKSFYVVEPTGF